MEKKSLKSQFEWFVNNLPLWKPDHNQLTLTADNIVLYYRKQYSEWRLKDTSVFSSQDIINVNPFIDFDIQIVKRKASIYHKSTTS